MSDPIISIRNLTVEFPTAEGKFRALDEVCLNISEGEHVAVIGESGCGKSVLGHSILRLLDGISETTGNIFIKGADVRSMSERELLAMRGQEVALIPQSPTVSLDPVIKIGKQIGEVYDVHGVPKQEWKEKVVESLGNIGFEDPQNIYETYPHRLSGGMCERTVICMGMSLKPAVLIADEPTKGLDPASKIDVLKTLNRQTNGKTLIMITHDYNAAKICERTVVMYSGRILEDGPTEEVMRDPKHPYTKALWGAMPCNGMIPIAGSVEKAATGCDFYNRCEHRCDECKDLHDMKQVSENHLVRCCKC
jgi:peptide/nickel transport system ATP-binding protein